MVTEMTKQTDVAQWYGQRFKAWPKSAGSKPTVEMLNTIHGLGRRAGADATLAAAMMLRPEGASQPQIVAVVGDPKLNIKRELEAQKVIRELPMPRSESNHRVYRIELTAKGTARVKGAAVETVPVKPKAAKARKVKVKPEATPAPAPVEVTVTDQPQA